MNGTQRQTLALGLVGNMLLVPGARDVGGGAHRRVCCCDVESVGGGGMRVTQTCGQCGNKTISFIPNGLFETYLDTGEPIAFNPEHVTGISTLVREPYDKYCRILLADRWLWIQVPYREMVNIVAQRDKPKHYKLEDRKE